jgi:toluene monooxygenase system protein E
MTAREARAKRVRGRPRRTYLPLEGQRHKPTDYEVTTSALLYYPARGFEVETPVWQHYVEYQRGSLLSCPDWEAFQDPAHTTYTSYVAARRDQEAFLDRELERAPGPVAPELRPLIALFSALRFPLHGLQMTAAYVGSLAPSGRISVAAALQAADELRRIQRLCQWLWRAGASVAELDALGRENWQQSSMFQPLRRLIEELLVSYDWGLALIALNGVVKPVFDGFCFDVLPRAAAAHGDVALERILRSLAEDGRWHLAWFSELAKLALGSDPRSVNAFHALEPLRGRSVDALSALVPLCQPLLADLDVPRCLADAQANVWAGLGLEEARA